MVLKSSWNASTTKDSTNGIKSINAFITWKLVLSVNVFGKNDMDGSNPCGDQTTHFVSWVESPNVTNFACNHNK